MTSFVFLSWLITFVCLSYFITVVKEKEKKVYNYLLLLSVFSLLIYIAGYRPIANFGDTARYIYVYSKLTDIQFAWDDGVDLYGNDELLFWPFAALLKKIGFEARTWLIFIVCWFFFITLISYKRLLKDNRYWVVIFSALFLTYHLVFMNSIRQAMVECLVLLAYTFLVRGNVFYALTIILFGTLFHTSAYFAFPILMFYFRGFKPNVKLISLLVMTSLFIAPLFSIVTGSFTEDFSGGVGNKIDSYVIEGNSNEYEDLWSLKQSKLMVVFSLIYVFAFSFKGNINKGIIYNWVLYYLLLVIFTSLVPVVSGRLMQYLSLVFPIMIWEIVSLLFFEKKKKILIFTFLFFALGVMVFLNPSAQIILGLDI